MGSIVEDLQRDALDGNVKVTDLLQKSLVVAGKLKLDDFAAWARLELDGYGNEKVPGYRILHGATMVRNPYHGYQPLQFADVEEAEKYSRTHIKNPIGQIEHDLLAMLSSASGDFQVSYSPQVEAKLMEAMEFPFQPSLGIGAAQLQGVIDAVRKAILEWSLRLELDGITGQGMSFS